MKDKLKKIIVECGGERVAITLILFVTILVGALALIFGPKADFSADENRVLESTPKISLDAITDGTFMSSVQNYIGDHFPLRKTFISLNTEVQLAMGKRDIGSNYGKTPAEGGVYVGSQGHLYEVLLPNKTDTFKNNITAITNFGKNAELPLVIMPVPSGSQEQAENLPAFAPNHDQHEELQALQSAAKAGTTVVNLFDTLSANKGDYYFKTDHHWNIYGAFEGYQALTTAIGVQPLTKSDFTFKTVSNSFYGTLYSKAIMFYPQADDFILPTCSRRSDITQQTGKQTRKGIYWEQYLTQKDKYATFLGGNHSVDVVRNTAVKDDKKLLIIKDSYANSLVPFLAQNFSEIHIVDLRYYNQDIYQYIKENQITNLAAVYSIKQLCEVPIGNKLNMR
jgi:hypothetical protein